MNRWEARHYQERLLYTIFALVMMNYKQNKSNNCENPKKRPDPMRKPPSNLAAKVGRPPPHLSGITSPQIQHKINNPNRPSQRFNQQIEQLKPLWP